MEIAVSNLCYSCTTLVLHSFLHDNLWSGASASMFKSALRNAVKDFDAGDTDFHAEMDWDADGYEWKVSNHALIYVSLIQSQSKAGQALVDLGFTAVRSAPASKTLNTVTMYVMSVPNFLEAIKE